MFDLSTDETGFTDIRESFELHGFTELIRSGEIKYDWIENQYKLNGKFLGNYVHDSIDSLKEKKLIDTLELLYRGNVYDFREFYTRKWCEQHNINPDKWSAAGFVLLDGIKAIEFDSYCKDHVKRYYSFSSGSSGCNFNLLDRTGGNHDVSFMKDIEFTFYRINKNTL